MFKVPSAWRAVTVDGYVDPSGGNRVNDEKIYFLMYSFLEFIFVSINKSGLFHIRPFDLFDFIMITDLFLVSLLIEVFRICKNRRFINLLSNIPANNILVQEMSPVQSTTVRIQPEEKETPQGLKPKFGQS